MADCLFCKIAKKELKSDVVYEDEKILAFNDIAPQSPVHILVIPKSHIGSITELDDYSVLMDLYKVINHLAVEKGIADTGFRVVVNHGRDSGQAVLHLHLHLLGGRPFSWPPG